MSRTSIGAFWAVVLAAALASACGPSAGTTGAPTTGSTGPSASAGGWSVVTPTGWQVQTFTDRAGAWVRVAPAGVDLLAPSPSSWPRLAVTPVPQSVPDPKVLIDSIKATEFVGPVSTTTANIDGRPAVTVEWTESGLLNASGPAPDQTFREILVDLGGGHAYSVLLEAPAGGWATAAPTLQQIADTLSFK